MNNETKSNNRNDGDPHDRYDQDWDWRAQAKEHRESLPNRGCFYLLILSGAIWAIVVGLGLKLFGVI